MNTQHSNTQAGRILILVVLGFIVISILAYRTMEHFQQVNDTKHNFYEEDALLALPQFRLVDSMLNFGGSLFSGDPTLKSEKTPYLVLAGSFTTQKKAEDHVQLLNNKGLKQASWVLFTGSRDIYAIAVSKHVKLEDARIEVDRLKTALGIDAYVHKVRNIP